jgi:hypothetical protein
VTTWLSVAAAAVLVAVGCVWVVRRAGLTGWGPGWDRSRRDPHWGDWPPDQMGQ